VTEASTVRDDDGMTSGLSVLVADEDTEQLRSTCAAVRELGHDVVDLAVSVAEAAERIATDDPDISIVAVHEDVEHAIDLIDEINHASRGPVVVVLAAEHQDFLPLAAQRGIDGFARSEAPHEVQTAIELAMRRHRQEAQLAEQVSQLETALERRSVIERAKGILMERHGVDERAAFALLRDQARNTGRKVVDLAASVAEGQPLLPRRRPTD
jgi:AmiR/NasT family two-component response regulator